MKGSERIREKIKSLRQDYRAAINRGTRSGSGKLIQDKFDLLTEIWGGSPATTSLPFGINGDTIGEETDTENPKAEDTYLLQFSSLSLSLVFFFFLFIYLFTRRTLTYTMLKYIQSDMLYLHTVFIHL